jgi:hypothetical protein
MGRYDHLDIFMKMLEVMAKDLDTTPKVLSTQERNKAITIISKLEGTLNVYAEQEVAVAGDNFENIQNSVIATRGAIAKGLITVRERRGPDVAEALHSLEEALSAAKIPDETRQEALDLIKEITGQAATAQPSKVVLKSLGTTLLKTLESVGSIADVVGKAWPVISSLWV